MNRRERRILKAIAYHQARLDRLDYRNYRREADYWRVVTYHINRIRGLSKLLRTGAQETSPCLVIAHKL